MKKENLRKAAELSEQIDELNNFLRVAKDYQNITLSVSTQGGCTRIPIVRAGNIHPVRVAIIKAIEGVIEDLNKEIEIL